MKKTSPRIKTLRSSLKQSRHPKLIKSIVLKPHVSNSQKPIKSNQLHSRRSGSLEKLPSLEMFQSISSNFSKKSFNHPKRNLSLEGISNKSPKQSPYKRNNSGSCKQPSDLKEWSPADLPYTVKTIFDCFSFALTSYEKLEITEYSQIYYIGLGIVKLIPDPKLKNNGYDNERSDLVLVRSDHLVYRYEILKIIGRGTYGQVVKVYDHKEKKLMAAKIIRNLSCIKQQAQVELQVLEKISKGSCDFVVKLVDSYYFRGHVIEVFELLETNLFQYIKDKNTGLNLDEVRTYAVQILTAIQYYQGLGIIHCDLKLENIMIDKGRAVVIDFGSACFVNKKMYTYIQSRYYRSPEVILEIGYEEKIDIWSLGCILAEISTGFAMFKGKNEQAVFISIVQVLGMPPTSMLERSPKCESLIQEVKSQISASKGTRMPGSRALEVILPQDPEFISFIKGCLSWDPDSRFSVSEALKHPFITSKSARRKPSYEIEYGKYSFEIPSPDKIERKK